MKLLYAVDYTAHTALKGAPYADGKVILQGLTELEIAEKAKLKDKVNRIDQMGFNPTNDPDKTGLSTDQLGAVITGLVAQEPNNNLGVLSIAQGKWLYANHPIFKPKTEGEV